MADTIGLTARLSFDGGAAIAGMGRVSSAFKGMANQVKMTKEGLSQVRQGFAGVGYAVAGVQTGVGIAVKRFANFEGQMGAVKAVLGKEAAGSFEALDKKAIQLGIDTAFTSTQAAEAMESLARSGMDADQIMAAIGPTLDAAAAEGMDLATAADIVSANMKAFGLEAKDTARIADTLAYVSAKTNTNMVELQEGLKFAAPVARTANVSLEQTASIMGVLADVGLKSSLAGTAFKNAIVKISQQAKNGKVEVGDYFAKIEYGKDGMMDAQSTFLNIVKAIASIKDPLKRVNVGMDLLGIRGQGVVTAFEALDPKKAAQLFDAMRKEGGATGKAAEMAKTRLDNLQGAFTLLESSVDIAVQSLGRFLAPEVTAGVEKIKLFVNDVTAAFSILGKQGTLGASEVEYQLGKLNQTAVGVVKGLREGFGAAKEVFVDVAGGVKWVIGAVRALISPIDTIMGRNKPMGVDSLIKTAFQFGAIALSVRVLGGALGRMATIASGSFKIIRGVLGTFRTGVGGVVNLLATKFPAIGKLAGPLGRLGRGVAALEKVTAQPVRIVNWDEAGMGGLGAGVAPGQMTLPGMGKPGAGAPAAGGIGLKGTIAGYGAAAVGGILANTLITGEDRGAVKTLANSALALGASFGPVGAAVGGVAAGALALGSKIDEWTGASTKISDAMWNYTKSIRAEAHAAYMRVYEGNLAYKNMQGMSQQLIGLAKRGVTEVGVEGGQRRALTAGFMQERLMKFAAQQKGMSAEQQKAMVEAVMKTMGPELQEAMKKVKVEATLNIDGRPAAKAVAGADQEKQSRMGKQPVGARRKAAS